MDVQANADQGSSHAYRCMQMNIVANFAPLFIHASFLVIIYPFFLLVIIHLLTIHMTASQVMEAIYFSGKVKLV